MSELAHRFCQGTHKIVFRPSPDRARTECRAEVERDYIHMLFTGDAGEIALGFPFDRARSDLSGANWDTGEGSIHLEGELGLNGTPVRCVADLDIRTMEGVGRLGVLAPAAAGATRAMQEPETDLTSAEGLAAAVGLDRNEVASVRVTLTASTGHSWLTFLDVTYAGAAAARLPARLVLKQRRRLPLAKPEPMREVDFYSGLAATLPSPPVVRCLAARAPAATAAGYILLEDVRGTHAEPPLDDEMYFEPAVDALARVHAAGWEARGLPADVSQTEPWIRTNLEKIAAHLPAFFDGAGDALRPEERALYERVFSSRLRPWLRPVDGRAVTLTHGSAHIANFLFAREPGGAACLVDWERWRVDLGARDLAYLMMLRRSPGGRRQLEERLLRRYLERLHALGVRGYAWDDLWADYRRCWVRNLTAPIRKQSRSDASWRELLDHAVAAYADLDCEELL